MHHQAPENSYDTVPYPTSPLPQTHPRRLETIAWLLSLPAPPSHNCRVLELGCGDGSNLLPMAVAEPNSYFLGIDASAVQIDLGRQRINALGLTNIQLEHRTIEQVDTSSASFDYIVCHGVFSWVSQRVQLAILRLIREMLTAEGIAYVSYNTQPGWHGRGAIRNMMNFHVGRYSDENPQKRIHRARGLLDFLTRATAGQQDSYGVLLRENLAQLNQLPDAYLFHEHLEEFNEPIWFLDFCEMLSRSDLRYLGEADFSAMIPPLGLSDEVRRELEELAPRLLEKEQYLDFVRNRSFRQTLICRAGRQPNYAVRGQRIEGLFVASQMLSKSWLVDYSPGVIQDFELGTETKLSTQLPIFKAALVALRSAWPASLPYAQVLREASQLLKEAQILVDGEDLNSVLAKALLSTYSSISQPLIELSRQPALLACKVSDTPRASPLARLQAGESEIVSNLRQESVRLSELERFLIGQLDGTHSLDELAKCIAERLPEEHPSSETSQTDMSQGEQDRAIRQTSDIRLQVVQTHLERLARYGLLLA